MKKRYHNPKDRTTIKQYKELIAEKREEWNRRISELDELKISAPLQKEIDKINSLKVNSRSRKADYKRLNRELQYALEWDLDTPEGQRQLDKKEKKAFESFNKHRKEGGYDEIPYEEWRDMVENFGSAGKAVLEQFYATRGYGSGDVVRVYRDAVEQGKNTNISKAMRDVIRESRGKGLTPTGMLDALRDKLGLNS